MFKLRNQFGKFIGWQSILNNFSFEKLIFANAAGNLKSRRVKEKTGAKLIDIKQAKFVNPEYAEHEIWELKKEDLNNQSMEYYTLNSEQRLLV